MQEALSNNSWYSWSNAQASPGYTLFFMYLCWAFTHFALHCGVLSPLRRTWSLRYVCFGQYHEVLTQWCVNSLMYIDYLLLNLAAFTVFSIMQWLLVILRLSAGCIAHQQAVFGSEQNSSRSILITFCCIIWKEAPVFGSVLIVPTLTQVSPLCFGKFRVKIRTVPTC